MDRLVNEDGEILLECPQCHEYDSETQIEDHGICYWCMKMNYDAEEIHRCTCGNLLQEDNTHCFYCGADYD